MAFLGFGRRDVSDGLQEPPVVEPIHPFQSSELDGLERAPQPAPVNDLGFVKTIDGLGQSIDAPIDGQVLSMSAKGFSSVQGEEKVREEGCRVLGRRSA